MQQFRGRVDQVGAVIHNHYYVILQKDREMSLMKCAECSAEISTTARSCPQCGARVPKPKLWLWVPLGLVGAFLLFGATVGNTPEANERAHARAVIKTCWGEQARKSLDSGTARFVASTCERLENDFRSKYRAEP